MENGGAIVPVGVAKTALPEALVTQTKAIGVILPPPDIRAIVDKTAQFVARNGTDFEKRILANEANNQKFNFLKDGDPYNAYYRKRVADFTAEDKGEAPAEGAAAAAPAAAPAAPAPAPAPEKPKPALPPTKPLEAPEEEQYTVHIPEGLTLLDLDVIKLTAQFVARNGKSFLTGLASREHANPQFNFLKPTHSLFGFFTALCDAYSRVLMPPKELRARLDKDSGDRSVILERALKRLEWERVQEKEAKEKAAREEAEREAMMSVDWHEFVVVETIEFYDDELDELPEPMTVKDVIRLSKAPQHEEPEPEAAAAAAAAAQQQDMEMDEEEATLVAQGAAAGRPSAAPAGEADMEMDMEESDDEAAAAKAAAAAAEEEEEEEGPMRPPTELRSRALLPLQSHGTCCRFVVSPITGELVPIGEMAEHMRISLIDPKYREQKEAMMAKIRDTTKASDDEISRNLVGLTRTLPHIFGTTAEEVSALVGKQIQEQRAREAAAARGPPPLPPHEAPPLPEEEPDAKRARLDTFVLTPEEEFADAHPGQAKVYVQCPKVDGSDALTGQLLAVEMPSLLATVSELKARLSDVLSLPPGKQQLSREHALLVIAVALECCCSEARGCQEGSPHGAALKASLATRVETVEDKQMAPDSDWELVDKPGPPGEQPDAVEPPVSPQPAPAAPESPARNPKHAEPEPPGLLEEIAAKGLFCLLCVVEAAVKMTAHATQMVRRAGMASAHLAHKLAAAARPALQDHAISRPSPSSQAILYVLNISFHQLQSETLFVALNHHGPLGEALHSLLMDVERASLAAGSQGLRLMAVLGHISSAEIKCRTGLPVMAQLSLLPSMLLDLRGMLADRDGFAHAAAEAERHQQAAGLDRPLSAANLQRLALLLHWRCTRHMNHSTLSSGLAAPELMQLESTINDELLALEGDGPIRACFLRSRGLNIIERMQHSQALPLWGPPLQPATGAAAYEAALVACESSRASLVEAMAAMNLAHELMTGGGGPRWSLARVRSVLDRAMRALARCKPWMPTPLWQRHKKLVAELGSKAAAFAAAQPGAGDSLAAVSNAQMSQSTAPQHVAIPSCAACGKRAIQLMVCSGCRSVAYCSRACQKQGWPAHKQVCSAACTAARGVEPAA
ncbi:hypothetical protein COHA_001191 [Chlorella ohadii]|uniref:Splicing factor 3A subunit 1 n=1 Tax=Chlorella ohadii TaxID=2649997 RepID=A0AAD5DZE0_9CHLO|nr:hypothetical protein COHA_001191 [Chlorella ohadii]